MKAIIFEKKGRLNLYIGRDMTELSMMSKSDWQNNELNFFHQLLPANLALFKCRRTKHLPRNYRGNI